MESDLCSVSSDSVPHPKVTLPPPKTIDAQAPEILGPSDRFDVLGSCTTLNYRVSNGNNPITSIAEKRAVTRYYTNTQRSTWEKCSKSTVKKYRSMNFITPRCNTSRPSRRSSVIEKNIKHVSRTKRNDTIVCTLSFFETNLKHTKTITNLFQYKLINHFYARSSMNLGYLDLCKINGYLSQLSRIRYQYSYTHSISNTFCKLLKRFGMLDM